MYRSTVAQHGDRVPGRPSLQLERRLPGHIERRFDDRFEARSEDSGDNLHLIVRFTDTKTSQVTTQVALVSPGEIPEGGVTTAVLDAKIAGRVKSVHRMLDAGGYRSLVALADRYEMNESNHVRAGLRSDFEDAAARVIDVASNSVLWQERFPALTESHPIEDDNCGHMIAGTINLAWSPQTRKLLVNVWYSGDCNRNVVRTFVRELPEP